MINRMTEVQKHSGSLSLGTSRAIPETAYSLDESKFKYERLPTAEMSRSLSMRVSCNVQANRRNRHGLL